MPSRAHISSTASASSASMNGGMARSNTTARPGSSTSQPMIRSVSGHSFSAEPVIRARPCSPLVTTAAAAPSPNRAVATIAAGSSLSSRIEIEQVSTVTNSQLLPGSAAASRAASDEAVDAAGAAQAEDRHAADVGAEAEPWPNARFEARRGDAGGRDGDDAVDLRRASARLCDRRAAPLRRTAARRPRDRPRCARAQPWLAVIPVRRSDEMALGDRRHCRTRPTAGRTAPSSGRTRARDRSPWRRACSIDVRRNRGGERE